MCIIILQLVTLLNVIPSCQYYVLPYFSSYILSSQLIQILNVTESPDYHLYCICVDLVVTRFTQVLLICSLSVYSFSL